MPSHVQPVRNRLLKALSAEDLERLQPYLEPVELKQRQVIHQAKAPIEYVYFIESGLVSVIARADETSDVEVWVLGCEGVAGLPAVLGVNVTPHKRIVQSHGSALRINTGELRRAMNEVPALRDLLMRYTYVVLIQTSQAGACNARHSIKQRLARWLLSARDRLGRDELPLSHQMLARMLGVRRTSVTECVQVLEKEGMLAKSRASLQVLDPEALESASCGCYRTIKVEYDRLLQQIS